MFPVEESNKHEAVLELNSPKSNGIFATDQTPTPTGLFRNCEEFGIFEDLKHVNPFEEIFRHAVEEKTAKAAAAHIHDEESLHTPQVFPPIDAAVNTISSAKNVAIARTQSANSDLTTPTPATTNELDFKATATNKTVEEPAIKKYRPIAEKPPTANAGPLVAVNLCDASSVVKIVNSTSTIGTAIPIQTVKPIFKVDTRLKPAASRLPTSTVTSPSSASLTPTSQLPIKERLKVILNNNKSQRAIANATELTRNTLSNASSHNNLRQSREASGKYDERCMERRRAAATRYRTKMRNEHKELRKRNSELQAENEKLRVRLAELEQQLTERQTMSVTNSAPMPLPIPPSSIHLIMNIPKLVVPANGPPLLHSPITYSLERK